MSVKGIKICTSFMAFIQMLALTGRMWNCFDTAIISAQMVQATRLDPLRKTVGLKRPIFASQVLIGFLLLELGCLSIPMQGFTGEAPRNRAQKNGLGKP